MSAAATYDVYTPSDVFDFARPDLSDLTVEDVATALSRLYRWRGSVPVTVAQHSVVMARCASSETVARWCLVHDVHEMFVADVPSPMKKLAWMRPYLRAEERLMHAVAERFGLAPPEPPELRRLDRRACRSEVEEFLPHALPSVRGLRPLPINLAPAWSAAQSRREFLHAAKDIGVT